MSDDTARLNWLEENPGVIQPENAVHSGWNADGFHDEEEGWADTERRRWYRTLRAAIDAAMKAEGQ